MLQQPLVTVVTSRPGEMKWVIKTQVKTFADKNEMNYPIVVDDSEGTITKQFGELGLQGFPHYILLDPQGRILHNNAVSDRVTLRSYKFETLYEAILSAGSK